MSELLKIFVSYRRADSGDFTERIHDRLVIEFGQGSVFLDVDRTIPPGVDFRDHLQNVISESGVFLTVIGPSWLDAREVEDPRQRRLDNPKDFVRMEIEAALADASTVLIPVLIHDATMPTTRDLPDSITELAHRQATRVRGNPDFHQDMTELCAVIRNSYEAPISDADLRAATERIREDLIRALDSDWYTSERGAIVHEFEDRRVEVISRAKELAASSGFELKVESDGAWVLQPIAEGKTIDPKQLSSLSASQQTMINERRRQLDRELDSCHSQLRSLEKGARKLLTDLLREVGRAVVDANLDHVRGTVRGDERATAYVDELYTDLETRIEELIGRERHIEFTSPDIAWRWGNLPRD